MNDTLVTILYAVGCIVLIGAYPAFCIIPAIVELWQEVFQGKPDRGNPFNY